MMFKPKRLLCAFSAWTTALFIGVALASAGALAQVRSVENIASASWSDGGAARTVQSNEVSFEIADSTATLSTFIAFPSGSQTATLQSSYCATRGTAGGDGDGPITTARTALTPTQAIRAGQRLVIRIDAPLANRDAAAPDELNLTLTTPSGDREQVTAIEDADDSGVFYASIQSASASSGVVPANCQLSLASGEMIAIEARYGTEAQPFLIGEVEGLADPFGTVFDSFDGTPVDGARVTIVDAATGQPAQVFSFDGVTPYPSTVISGESATDAAGVTLPVGPGEYRFPLVDFGQYRLLIEPPAPYTAPSQRTPAELAALRAPDGLPFELLDASYGGTFTVESIVPLRVDVPLDATGGTVSLTKTASRELAEPGDAVVYTLTLRNTDSTRPTSALTLLDSASAALRLRTDTVRIGGEEPGEGFVADDAGHGFALTLDPLEPGATLRVTYAMTVREDAAIGEALNEVTLTDADGEVAEAQASVRIARDGLTARMTIIGQVLSRSDGDVCVPEIDGALTRIGIPGVRVTMEDGSFAITDADGRYHFEGVVPGNHVVQVARSTLPEGSEFVDCVDSTRSAGSAISRFVSGQGGSLARADFHAQLPQGTDVFARVVPQRNVLDNITASGANTDFMADGDGPDGFVFPGTTHNPRSPSVRVVIRHRVGHRVELVANGAPVNPLAFDGTTTSDDDRYALSAWRAVDLPTNRTTIIATIRDTDGVVVSTHERDVHYATTPLRAELVLDQSNLTADGATPSVLAVRMLNRAGRPVHSGISGTLMVDSPYQTQSALDNRASEALSGFGNSQATWLVEGDDGIAYIQLAPTMVSGSLRATFSFSDGDATREQELEAWIEPGDQPWTLIGLAEGSIGARSVADNMERAGNGSADFDSDLGEDARVAFYAKGRVLGEYLLTIAYDSAKQADDQRLLGTIDPAAYYTVFGDNSQRLFDAASTDKLYVRVESSTFYALYGDFETGFDQTQLAQYQRIATGVRTEARFGQVQVEGFAAKIGANNRRDEIQGAGISGPYQLSSRGIIANSEIVRLEVRDRLRSEIIIESRELIRFVDYNIDLLSGTITFAQPVLSRDAALNPRFIIVDFDVDALGEQQWNAGARAAWTSADGSLRIAATGITDSGDADALDDGRTNLGAVDVRLRLGNDTEIRAEAGVSEQGGERSEAYLAEIEHHSGNMDVLAYAQQTDSNYGVGQQNAAERGRRKIGADARLAVSEQLTVSAAVWQDEGLDDGSKRQAGEVRAAWRNGNTVGYVGVAHLNDALDDGTLASSTVLQAGGSQILLGNDLQIVAATSVPLSSTDAIDLPTQHSLSARYSITNDIRAVGTYEIARGDAIDANTFKFGAEITPWNGGTIVSAIGQERVARAEQGSDANRTFAAFTFGYSFRATEQLLLDATIDSNTTLGGGIAINDVINAAQPVASGGQLGSEGSLGEDFTAVTLGASWSDGPWNARARGEYRDGEFADLTGLDIAAIRSLGNGSVVGSGVTWTRAEDEQGGTTEIVDAAISVAHRPDQSDFAMLGKLEYRSDAVTGAISGQVGAAGQTALLVDGDARLRRLLASLSTNWAPTDDEDGFSRTEIGLFLGVRHSFDRVDQLDIDGTSLLGGLDLRYGISDRFEVGGRATARHDLVTGTTAFAIGPEVGFVPTDNVLLSVGYNITGFRDPDFSGARFTNEGLFANVRIKLDDDTMSALGLGGAAE